MVTIFRKRGLQISSEDCQYIKGDFYLKVGINVFRHRYKKQLILHKLYNLPPINGYVYELFYEVKIQVFVYFL